MTTTVKKPVAPTSDQLTQTRQKIDAYIQSIDANPNHRVGAYPYYRFHEVGQTIRGTVLIFHGFSSKPDQMWRLADYLFQNGFNFYQATLAGHAFLPAAKFWPQVDLKPDILNPLRAKVQQDPVLKNYIANLPDDASNFQRPGYLQQAALISRLLLIEPRLLDIVAAAERDNDAHFDRYFDSTHMDYLTDARSRLAELEAMPGPIYTVGLSVGGAVALALAADQPNRIKRVVSYAPLLKIYDPQREQYVELAGPLDISETGWDPSLRFPVGAFTAASRFGAFVRQPQNISALQNVPTFMPLTENEDAASVETNKAFFQAIGGKSRGHRCYVYPKADLVPHPMVDPTTVSQRMTNHFWQSLYQETFRFLTRGEIDPSNMSSLKQNSDLPQVPPLT
ncbi:MAG TPA: alpha/beta fold hydrolase [Candidatus Sericytochromatia bacterium]|jgi:alpha-beta hydrolase superfamily lysophospholipase